MFYIFRIFPYSCHFAPKKKKRRANFHSEIWALRFEGGLGKGAVLYI